ncbi:MAG: FAD-binding protein [Gammaproteobacteria bacterium]
MASQLTVVQPAWTRIEPALAVDDVDAVDWDDAADVVVVGFGGAGACAAIQARQDGASVLALDRFGGGGATAYSGGVVYAGGTRVQRDAGVEDDAGEMCKYLAMEVGDVVSGQTLRRYCEGTAGDIDWLAAQGVQFSGTAFLEKTAYPPDGKYLYYSGNEQVEGYREHARPAPRGHRTVGSGFTGPAYFAALRTSALAAGVQLIPHARAMRLLVDRGGAVVGVEAAVLPPASHPEHERLYGIVSPYKPMNWNAARKAMQDCDAQELAASQRRLYRARAGVILSTGGYVYNQQMLRRHRPILADHFGALLPLASAGCDGSGVELGESAGGAIALMDSVFLSTNIAPPPALLQGIIVNSRGQRFINETAYSGFIGNATTDQPDGAAWLIVDSLTLRTTLRQIFGGIGSGLFRKFHLPALLNIVLGGTRRGRDAQAIAARCGIDAAGLAATIAEYNRTAAAHGPDAFGKSAKYLRPLQGACYALNLCIGNRFAFKMAFSLGGLRVDEDTGEVRRPDGTNIPGLYAAGRTAVGLCSKGYLSGMSLGDCVFSGRRAGRDCARRAAASNSR